MVLKGVCLLPDDHSVKRADFEGRVQGQLAADLHSDIITSIVDKVRENEPIEHYHRQIFYVQNQDRKLHYYTQVCRDFCVLAEEVNPKKKKKKNRFARFFPPSFTVVYWLDSTKTSKNTGCSVVY